MAAETRDPVNSKPLLQSKSIVGSGLTVALFGLLAMFGYHLDREQTLGTFAAGRELAAVVTGMVAGIVAIYGRLKHIELGKVNWTTVVAAVGALLSTIGANGQDIHQLVVGSLGVLAAFGVRVDDVQQLVSGTDELVLKLPGFISGALMLWGGLTVKKRVEIRRATVVPLIALLPLGLCQCTAFNKLSPETQALIEQKAIAAATAAASTAAQGVIDGKKAKDIARDAGKAALEAVKTQPVENAL